MKKINTGRVLNTQGIIVPNDTLPECHCEKLIKVLEEIQKFGFENSGCGYSCAKLAQKVLRMVKNETV